MRESVDVSRNLQGETMISRLGWIGRSRETCEGSHDDFALFGSVDLAKFTKRDDDSVRERSKSRDIHEGRLLRRA